MKAFTAIIHVLVYERADRSGTPQLMPETEAGAFRYELERALDAWVESRISDDGPSYDVQVVRGIDTPE